MRRTSGARPAPEAISRVLVAGALVALAVAGCSESETATPTTRPPSTTTTTINPNTCSDDPALRDDDVPAGRALLKDDQLPVGSWRSVTECRWSFSGQDLLSIPECQALIGDAAAAKEDHTGYARATWARADGEARLDHRSELWGSPRKPELIDVLFASAGVAECFEAAMREQATNVPDTTIEEIEVTTYDVGLRAADVGVSFIGGVSIAANVESRGRSVPMALRVVTFRAGGGLATVTLTGEGSAGSLSGLDAIDLGTTVRTAITSLRASFGLSDP